MDGVRVSRKSARRAAGRSPRNAVAAGPATWLAESEKLFEDFRQLTPYKYRPFVRSFSSFVEYERWKRAQKNPWYR